MDIESIYGGPREFVESYPFKEKVYEKLDSLSEHGKFLFAHKKPLGLMVAGNTLGYFTTMDFVNQYGTCAELNPFIRQTMDILGPETGLITLRIIGYALLPYLIKKVIINDLPLNFISGEDEKYPKTANGREIREEVLSQKAMEKIP
jgi:hypothetical protein